MLNQEGKKYIDFLSGCGALNYGHNQQNLKQSLSEYFDNDGLVMGMDLDTEAKLNFFKYLDEIILTPRNLNYKIQLCGPTGTNAVEAALKLARKKTGRNEIIAFTNAFHGCSLGALSATANKSNRTSSASMLVGIQRMPFDGYMGNKIDMFDLMEKMIDDPSGGVNLPAAFILETLQAEGGLNSASIKWMKRLVALADKIGALIIIDEIQTGCGRTGTFFSFEHFGIHPDIIVLSKSLSGLGLPMSVLLMKPDLDIWEPGEHSGTFRGNNYAFVTATAALKVFWENKNLSKNVYAREKQIKKLLQPICNEFDLTFKGRGLLLGIELNTPENAKAIQEICFKKKLIVELCGPYSTVLKLLPPLNIDEDVTHKAIQIIIDAFYEVLYNKRINAVVGTLVR